MYKKISLALALVAILSVQCATSLKCYSCSSPTDCNSAKVVTCENLNTDTYLGYLREYFLNVPIPGVNPEFRCHHTIYTNLAQNVSVIEVAGCVYHSTNACSLNPQDAFLGLTQIVCTDCQDDECNRPRNPAGTYSSSFFTILGSALLLMGAKFFV